LSYSTPGDCGGGLADFSVDSENAKAVATSHVGLLVTGSDPSVTDYILEMRAKCPNCRREILEKTLVEPV